MIENDRHKILVVEDSNFIRNLLVKSLREHYDVLVAGNGEEALAIAFKELPKLILLDIVMPLMDGYEVCRRLKASLETKNIPVVFITSMDEEQDEAKGLAIGAIDYITKPFSEAIVLARVRNHVEREMMESQLIQSSKLASIGLLASGIAHEINNPLGFVKSNIGNLDKFAGKLISFTNKITNMLENYDIPQRIKDEINAEKEQINYGYITKRMDDMLKSSKDGVERIKKIVADLKSFSRVDAAEVDEADINSLLDITLNILHNEHKDRITIKKVYGDIRPIKCFVSKINQVLLNLLINACHAIENEGEIQLKTFEKDDVINVEISDTGSGIQQEHMDKLFNPFFTTKPVGEGTGLGLSVSYGIIKQHSGIISVKSVLHKGSTFTIKLPLNPDLLNPTEMDT